MVATVLEKGVGMKVFRAKCQALDADYFFDMVT
jgi:hypothetical protein